MEMEDVHASKRSRMGGGSGDGGANVDAAKAAQEQRQDEDEEDGEGNSLVNPDGGGPVVAGVRGLRPWHQHSTASRIYRVSRASGGKDRHSKVMTAKGLRDRRVRLSVSTAIQFYDLQDRLGYDQPSKAIEWLINAAKAAIEDLPSLDGSFPDDQPPPGKQPGVNGESPLGTANEDEEDADISQLQYTSSYHLQHQQEERQHQQQRQQHLSLTKSTCSSTSETSKGSVLSLSRSEIRVKARERARERTATAKDKDKDMEDDAHIPSAAHHQSMNPNPTSQSSFTELLTGGAQQNHAPNQGPVTVAQANPTPNLIHKQLCHLPTSTTAAATTDYFGQVGLLGATGQKPHQTTIIPAQTHFGGSSPMGMVPFNVAAAAAASSGDHQEMQQHYMQEHLIPFAVTPAGGDYINFMSSGFNRGTLQSNSPSPVLNHHLQMFSSPVDGSNLPFFLGAAAQAASASGEGQLPDGFDSRLQLYYGGYRYSDLKGKGKN